jgi:tetratricopeptide (TPR) repeat protein
MDYKAELEILRRKILNEIPFFTIRKGTKMPALEGYYFLEEDIDVPILLEDFAEDLKKTDIEEKIDLEKINRGMSVLLGLDPSFIHNEKYKTMLNKTKTNLQAYLIHLINYYNQKKEYALMVSIALVEIEDSSRNLFILANSLENLSIDYYKSENTIKGKIFFEESIRNYIKSEESDSKFSLPLYKLGFYYKNQGEFLRAKDYWDRFLTLDQDPNRIEEIRNELEILEKLVDYEVGYKYVREGRTEEGLDLLLPLIEIYPNWWNLFFVIGLAFRQSDEYKIASDYFKKVLEIKPNQVETMNELSLCYISLGLFKEAKEILDSALAISEKNCELLSNRAAANIYLEDINAALKDINMALKIDPQDEIALSIKKEIEKMT